MSAVLDANWHAKRARVVGGSEIAALYQCQQPYQMGLYALWHYKAGNIEPPPVDGERIEWGNDLEEAIANVIARRKGWKIRKGGHVVDVTTPGLGCTLDYEIINDPRGPGALEIKNVDWLIHRAKWIDGEPPAHILLQLQHQLAATGFSWGVVAALVGGNRLEIYEYEARLKLISDIRYRVRAFWASIEAGKPPPIDGSDSAFHALRELYPEPIDDAICLDGDNEFPVICAELYAATEARKAAALAEDELKARIMEKLDGHRRAWGSGWSVNLSITKENPGREAKPGEIIGARKEVRRLNVKEYTQK